MDTVTRAILLSMISRSQHPPYNVLSCPQTLNHSVATLSLVTVIGDPGLRLVRTNGNARVVFKLYSLQLELKLITPLAKVIVYSIQMTALSYVRIKRVQDRLLGKVAKERAVFLLVLFTYGVKGFGSRRSTVFELGRHAAVTKFFSNSIFERKNFIALNVKAIVKLSRYCSDKLRGFPLN